MILTIRRAIPFLSLFFLAGADAQLPTSEMISTNLVEDGQPIQLELVIYRPDGDGPFPTLVFNHGSTGTGSDPSLFDNTWSSQALADFFTERGWLVVFPQRRGRGKSDGLYDEGFTVNRSGYTCDPTRSLAGMERALTDIDEIVTHLKVRPEVLPNRMVIGGQSRGGILSIVYAGTRPDAFKGVINFVGGWMSDSCNNPHLINTVSFRRGADYPQNTLWLYGLNDPFYSISHSEENFDAFIQAGGKGEFETFFPLPGFNGHGILFTPALWRNTMVEYIDQLPAEEPPTLPTITDFQKTNSETVELEFTTLPSQRYRLFKNDSLSLASEWQPASDILVGDGENATLEMDLVAPQFFTIQAH